MKRDGGKHVVGQLGQSGIFRGVRRSADDKRIDVAGIVNFAGLGRIEEDAVAATNHGFVAQPIGKTKSGSEWLLRCSSGIVSAAVAIEAVAVRSDRAAQPGNVCGAQRFIGVTQSASWVRAIKPEHLVVLFKRHGAVVPTQSQIQGKTVAYLPVVLDVWGEILEVILIQIARHSRRAERTRLKGRGIVVIAKQEVSHGIAGAAVPGCIRTAATVRLDRVVIKTELAEEVIGKVSLLHPATIVEAHRDGVPAVSHRE